MSQTPRYHGLDLLRAFAMMLGLLMHAPTAYITDDVFVALSISPRGPENVADWIYVLLGWIHQWRMPAFFILAGFFGLMVLRRRGAGYYLQDRIVRIGLTLVVFGLLIDALRPPVDLELGHLWFIYYLTLICVLASLVYWLGEKVAVLGVLAKALAWPAKRLWTLALYLIPLGILTPVSRDLGWAIIPETFGEFHPLPFLYYVLWFAIGAALFEHRAVLESFKKIWVILLSFFIAVIGMFMAFEALFTLEDYTGTWADWAVASVVSTGAWCVFFIGLSLRLLNGTSAIVNWFVELSYPVYIVHLEPSIWLGAGFIAIGVSSGAAFWPVVIGAFIASVAIYYALIKFTPLDWLICGAPKAWFRPSWLGLGKG